MVYGTATQPLPSLSNSRSQLLAASSSRGFGGRAQTAQRPQRLAASHSTGSLLNFTLETKQLLPQCGPEGLGDRSAAAPASGGGDSFSSTAPGGLRGRRDFTGLNIRRLSGNNSTLISASSAANLGDTARTNAVAEFERTFAINAGSTVLGPGSISPLGSTSREGGFGSKAWPLGMSSSQASLPSLPPAYSRPLSATPLAAMPSSPSAASAATVLQAHLMSSGRSPSELQGTIDPRTDPAAQRGLMDAQRQIADPMLRIVSLMEWLAESGIGGGTAQAGKGGRRQLAASGFNPQMFLNDLIVQGRSAGYGNLSASRRKLAERFHDHLRQLAEAGGNMTMDDIQQDLQIWSLKLLPRAARRRLINLMAGRGGARKAATDFGDGLSKKIVDEGGSTSKTSGYDPNAVFNSMGSGKGGKEKSDADKDPKGGSSGGGGAGGGGGGSGAVLDSKYGKKATDKSKDKPRGSGSDDDADDPTKGKGKKGEGDSDEDEDEAARRRRRGGGAGDEEDEKAQRDIDLGDKDKKKEDKEKKKREGNGTSQNDIGAGRRKKDEEDEDAEGTRKGRGADWSFGRGREEHEPGALFRKKAVLATYPGYDKFLMPLLFVDDESEDGEGDGDAEEPTAEDAGAGAGKKKKKEVKTGSMGGLAAEFRKAISQAWKPWAEEVSLLRGQKRTRARTSSAQSAGDSDSDSDAPSEKKGKEPGGGLSAKAAMEAALEAELTRAIEGKEPLPFPMELLSPSAAASAAKDSPTAMELDLGIASRSSMHTADAVAAPGETLAGEQLSATDSSLQEADSDAPVSADDEAKIFGDLQASKKATTSRRYREKLQARGDTFITEEGITPEKWNRRLDMCHKSMNSLTALGAFPEFSRMSKPTSRPATVQGTSEGKSLPLIGDGQILRPGTVA
eukprot:TRINITY_DN2347_c0_g1_i1.p1 TRINITY_DN2347_c0_g1~~TRINITY_DN2347_c0_g1_i1.p1  ORF type:complete len:904 (+),score=245.89 TRINITY_DN2347_c0_g1_i1:157-2868(+)